MYKGLAQLVGMKKLEGAETIAQQFERYLAEYDNYDFFFIHYKYTDMYGEDGNFAASGFHRLRPECSGLRRYEANALAGVPVIRIQFALQQLARKNRFALIHLNADDIRNQRLSQPCGQPRSEIPHLVRVWE